MAAPQALTANPEAGTDGRNPWLAVIVTTLVFFLSSSTCRPSTSHSRRSATTSASPSRRSDGSSPATTSLSPPCCLVAGRYADSLGRKRLFIPGVAIFAVGSIFSALSPERRSALIAARVVQGIGGAHHRPHRDRRRTARLPAQQALDRDRHHGRDRCARRRRRAGARRLRNRRLVVAGDLLDQRADLTAGARLGTPPAARVEEPERHRQGRL